MKLKMLWAIGILQCGCWAAPAQTPALPAAPKQAAAAAARPAKAAGRAASDAGERKFRENCSRCHNQPEELPERVNGTVVLHMRVRASLSAADERAILRYLEP